MSEQSNHGGRAGDFTDRLTRYLPLHFAIYAVVLILIFVLQLIAPGDRGLFMPMLIWAIFILAHYLFIRATATDQDWVEERSSNIMMKATDLSHIDAIRERYEEKERQIAASEKSGDDRSPTDQGKT